MPSKKYEAKFDSASDAIVGFLEQGHTRNAASALAGVSKSSVQDWFNLGKADIAAGKMSTKYARFVTEATAAMGRAQGAVENALYAAAVRGNVGACVAWLRQRAPDDWSDTQRVVISGSVGVSETFTETPDEELRGIVKDSLEAATRLMN